MKEEEEEKRTGPNEILFFLKLSAMYPNEISVKSNYSVIC